MSKNEEMENLEQELIETIDEDGNVINFELVDIFEMDGKEYGLLLPQDEKENDSEENEVVLMRLTKEGEEYVFEMIEDDDEFNRVADFIESLDEIESEEQ